ncbi:site-specific DNA-methyltransferase [Conexibacter sp. CPCC 206217]|uniref:DNA-methyltransferase n=1 Tax=Conexibacter sp. CPCC 206217 TaxID=3064574 RepID=UPI002723209B|nr:site-specific DNA-methyltransferase [Conexibacter sp. CPCC 206217]MDO8213904.1 site-specific DNA-methyltransferase [Conexibacter sp. CPCC 206217]
MSDPPYGIDFKGIRWDGATIRETAARRTGRRLTSGQAFAAWTQAWASEARRVLKPGAHAVVFGAPRTFHRLACGLEDAGLDVRDVLCWMYGTGVPKSRRLPGGRSTTLKPAWEPILLTRRPTAGTVDANLDRYRTGELNIDAARIDGRYPPNVALGHSANCTADTCTPDCAAALIDRAAAATLSPASTAQRTSRIFWSTKATRAERDAGLDHLPARAFDLFPDAPRRPRTRAARNPHPTVKPLALMRWLVRLTVPDGGLVLDPFTGSGSTGCAAVLEGRRFIGIEIDPAYARVATARLRHWDRQAADPGPFDRCRR